MMTLPSGATRLIVGLQIARLRSLSWTHGAPAVIHGHFVKVEFRNPFVMFLNRPLHIWDFNLPLDTNATRAEAQTGVAEHGVEEKGA